MWTARAAADEETFEVGEKVVTKKIEGVKLIVSAAETAAENKEEK
jgi:membrane protein implicated in regulation of membrane protease activity